MSILKRFWLFAILHVCFVFADVTSAAELIEKFTLTEMLDYDWEHELVFFPVKKGVAERGENSCRLLGPDGNAFPFQFVKNKNGWQIAFLTDLSSGKKVVYRLVDDSSAKAVPSDLRVSRSDKCLEVSNNLIGIRVPSEKGEFDHGPLLAVKLRSGKWSGTSRLFNKKKIKSYSVTVTAQGRVFADVTCQYLFANDTVWQITFRLIAGEPVVILDETFNLGDDCRWEFVVSGPDFKPDAFAFRNTMQKCPGRGNDASTVIQAQFGQTATMLHLEPWLSWWGKDSVQFFGTFASRKGIRYVYDPDEKGPVEQAPVKLRGTEMMRENGDASELTEKKLLLTTQQHRGNKNDVFFAAAGNASRWSEPGKKEGPKKFVPVNVSKSGEAYLRAQLEGPGRKWIFGTSTVADTVKVNSELGDPQKYFLKYCITPLQSVIELPLVWEQAGKEQVHPWLFFDRADVARAKERFPDTAKYASPRKKVYWNFLQNPTPETKAAMRKQVLSSLKRYIGNFTRGTGLGGVPTASPTKGTVHYCEALAYLLLEVDLAFSSDIFTPEEKSRIRSQMAFLAARIGSPDYYDLGRDHRANPNMTTMRYMITGLFACFLSDHPYAKDWYRLAYDEIDRELKQFAGPNGGWIESPHYQTLSHIMILFQRAAYRAGLCKEPYNPKLLKSILYLARISTPRDRSFYGLRHFPAVGDTPRYELSMIYSVMAKVIKDHDPKTANELQWIWYEQGKPLVMGIGGDCMPNYISEYLVADFKPNGAPDWKSELFPLGAAVLRSGFPSGRETQLHLYGGMKWSHYSHDNGAFTLYGKGQPLVLDWGYKGIMPTWWHSKMDLSGMGYFKQFSTQDVIDTVRFEYRRKDTWLRSVMMVKSKDPLGPNYYLINDWVQGKGKKDKWFLWLYTKKVPMAQGNVVHVTGRGDVDLDIYFAPPFVKSLKRIDASAASFINDPNKVPDVGKGDLQMDDETVDELGLEEEKLSPYVDTKSHSYSNATGRVHKGKADLCYRYGNGADPIFQRSITLEVPREKPLLTVLYPRLRKQKPPKFTPMGNQGVKVESQDRTDYAFLSGKPFSYKDKDVAFNGIAGTVTVSKDKVTLALGAAGAISYKNLSLKSEKPATKTFPVPHE